MRTPVAIFTGIIGPIRTEVASNGQIVLTHLQKYSRCGFLITWPFCFHLWFFWHKQEQNEYGIWIPGSESGIYARTPGWRYDIDLGMKFTRGYVGGHWD